MALNNSVRVTLTKPDISEVPRPDASLLHPGPGNNWNDPAFRREHQKKQLLSQALNGTVTSYKPVIRNPEPMPGADTPSAVALQQSMTLSNQGKSAELTAKTHVTLEDKVLRFFAYFVEAVKESAVETERTRKVSITYFPADDTVMVQEPRVNNSGINGGTILKRQRAAGANGNTVSINDFTLGSEIVILGRSYQIYDCDAFTRAFMSELGVNVEASQLEPQDRYINEYRMRKIDGPKTPGQTLANDNRVADDQRRAQRFIEDSGKVLRFFGYWDDRDTPDGQLYRLDIRYFIEDDQLAVFEQTQGATANATFMSKRRLPKDGTTNKAVELTFAGRVNGMQAPYMGPGDKYYTCVDLRIGNELNVFGRRVKLTSCDGWTRDYYMQKYGIDQGEPIDVSFLSPPKKTYSVQIPPPTGFGTHEDSLASTKSLILKPPRPNLNKGDTGEILRFEMKLDAPERTEDEMRTFTLSYFLDDDEIMITEIPVRNTGFTGGKFMKKQRIPKTKNVELPDYYTIKDIEVGKVLTFDGFRFRVTRADGRTETILAARAGKAVAKATNVTRERLVRLLSGFQEFVTVRFCTLTEAFRSFDKDKDNRITFGELKAALKDNQVTNDESEVIAVLQQVDVSGTGYVSYQDLFAFMSNPVTIREDVADLDGLQQANDSASVNKHRILRNRVLKELKERLETRCLNGFEMFRMISTMPRAFKGRRADLMSLTNGAKDTVFTPVQLRRAVTENLGMILNDSEMGVLLDFFFPQLPTSAYKNPADTSFEFAVDLKLFQAKLTEMGGVDQLK